MELRLPSAFSESLSGSEEIALFLGLAYIGEDEVYDFFEPIPYSLDESNSQLRAAIPPGAFINFMNSAPGFEAILIPAVIYQADAKGELRSSYELEGDLCKGLSLLLPIPPDSEVKTRRTFDAKKLHFGVDLKVPNGTSVFASEGGVIARVGSQGSRVLFSELKKKYQASCKCLDDPICTKSQGSGSTRTCLK